MFCKFKILLEMKSESAKWNGEFIVVYLPDWNRFYKKYSIYFISQKILFVIFSLLFYYMIGPEGVLLGIGLSFLPFLERIYRGFKDTPLNFHLLKTKWKFMTNNFLLDFFSETKIKYCFNNI